MNNKTLLEEVIDNRLASVKDSCGGDEEKKAFREAMEATDRHIQMERLKLEREKLELEKQKVEAKDDQKFNRIMKCVEVVAVPVGVLVLDFVFKQHYMKKICTFEKDYTFTTTPGKSIGSIFRFK